MSEIGHIKPVERGPDPDVVEFIEKLLERAKSGEVIGIACVSVQVESCTGTGWCNVNDNVMQVLGAMDVLHRDIMDSHVDLRIDPETGES